MKRIAVLATMMRRNLNSINCSSLGRLFDGVAALLGICTHAEDEAHGPIAMEGLLQRELDMAEPYVYALPQEDGMTQVDVRPMILQIVSDLETGLHPAHISRRFHSTIVDLTGAVCVRMRQQHHVQQIILSGGVFLNEFLQVNALLRLQDLGFDVYCHRTAPANDGGIALGQLVVANAMIRNRENNAVCISSHRA